MGFDISYHPISEPEMDQWYFGPLGHILAREYAPVEALAQQHGIEEFYLKKYIDTLEVGATPSEHGFDKTHGYYLAVVQGFFRTYYYTRGSAFSFLINEKPQYRNYTKTWQDILGPHLKTGARNQIFENYCSGVYIPYEQVCRLLDGYAGNAQIKADLEEFYSHGRLQVFLKALTDCREHELGLLEATEVVEPQPLDLNKSVSYSNLFNCDTEGPFLYHEAAMEQIREIEKQNNLKPGEIANNATYEKVKPGEAEEKAKKGFWKKLFG